MPVNMYVVMTCPNVWDAGTTVVMVVVVVAMMVTVVVVVMVMVTVYCPKQGR